MPTAGDLLDRGASSTELTRWRQRGWIASSTPVTRGGNARYARTRTAYPEWARRMVDLLIADRRSGSPSPARDALTSATATALAEHPDAGWFVFLDLSSAPVACYSAAEVTEACARVELVATIVSPPY